MICSKDYRCTKASELEAENANLRAVADAAQRLLNEVHCYSTGIALMAEEDMAQLFGEFTEAQEQLLALTEKRGSLP